ncbi:hypothetical protein [Bacillus massiliigorillae]|nr:hypothetical protein [Bacillus massiliigorillae]
MEIPEKTDEIEDGLCVQILNHGDYDEEPLSFEKLALANVAHWL